MLNSSKIEMTFICDQKWSKMKRTEAGRFCAQCNKEVLDFRKHSLTQINELKSNNGDLCGYFDETQVLNSDVPIQLNYFSKTFALASTLFLLNTVEASAQTRDSVKVEKIDSTQKSEKTDSICVTVTEPVEETKHPKRELSEWEKRKGKRIMRIGKLGVFVKVKFPFIAFRVRRATMGRF